MAVAEGHSFDVDITFDDLREVNSIMQIELRCVPSACVANDDCWKNEPCTAAPLTLERTTLARLRPGDSVHLEVDVFAKYLKQYLDRVLPGLLAAALDARGDAAKS